MSTSAVALEDTPFSRAGPMPLPPDEQREFERLVRERQESDGQGGVQNLHPDAVRRASPEFDGDTNPATGEIGGPKNDPLKWQSEWTFGGRATDF